MKRILFILLILGLSSGITSEAQRVQTLTGKATYYGDDNDSPASAKRKALEMARIDAMAREFGTVLSQTTLQRNEALNGNEDNFFATLSSTEVKGEWIADAGEPHYSVELDGDGHYVVTCRVTIKARALSNKAADFYAEVLRNGLTKKHAATDFRSGDEMFLSFTSPVDGYMAAYLVCGSDVMTLLPYLSSASGKCKVNRNQNYVFFSASQGDSPFGTADEYILQTDKGRELNQLYVLFSPNEFSKALDQGNGDGVPRSQSYDNFVKWLEKLRRADDEMGMKVFNIIISEN